MFYPSRVVDIPDGKPKWTGIDKSSELIEDSPPELKKRKREEAEQARKKEQNGDSGNH